MIPSWWSIPDNFLLRSSKQNFGFVGLVIFDTWNRQIGPCGTKISVFMEGKHHHYQILVCLQLPLDVFTLPSCIKMNRIKVIQKCKEHSKSKYIHWNLESAIARIHYFRRQSYVINILYNKYIIKNTTQ